MTEEPTTVTLTLESKYRFLVDFHLEGVPPLLVDESPPVGDSDGPSPSRLLAAAVGNCLGASLLFCLRKARVDVRALQVTANVRETRNEQGRLRIGGIDVRLTPDIALEDQARAKRCLEIFEDYCVVTQSVRGGIEVSATVVGVGETPAAA